MRSLLLLLFAGFAAGSAEAQSVGARPGFLIPDDSVSSRLHLPADDSLPERDSTVVPAQVRRAARVASVRERYNPSCTRYFAAAGGFVVVLEHHCPFVCVFVADSLRSRPELDSTVKVDSVMKYIDETSPHLFHFDSLGVQQGEPISSWSGVGRLVPRERIPTTTPCWIPKSLRGGSA